MTDECNRADERNWAGECNCGAVRFEIASPPAGVYMCHCSICRRSTGSNGIAVVVVPNEDFRWTRGQEHITAWTKPNSAWESTRSMSTVPRW